MADRVYLVTSGEYSDYSIDAVFSTREKAERYIQREPPEFGEARVEEFEVDGQHLDTRLHYRVDSRLDSIEVGEVLACDGEEEVRRVERRVCKFWAAQGRPATTLRVFVMADDVRHATKIAADLFRQFVAEEPIEASKTTEPKDERLYRKHGRQAP